MRIFVITPRQYHSYNLCNSIDASKHDITLVSLSAGSLVRRFKRNDSQKLNRNIKVLGNFILSAMWKLDMIPDRFKYFLFDLWVLILIVWYRPDSLIVWSGFCRYSLSIASRMSIPIIIERGSTHIVFQQRILAEIGDSRIPDWVCRREQQNYAIAKFIMVPSQFVAATFPDKDKIILNPYGINEHVEDKSLAEDKLDSDYISILYVGSYSKRKGIDRIQQLLTCAIGMWDSVRFVHIGDTNELDLEIHGVDIIECGFVKEEKIQEVAANYKYHLGIQLSYEEGLSRVLGEYVRCSIPILSTLSTGIDGLAHVNPVISDGINFRESLDFVQKNYSELARQSTRANQLIKKMSWKVYGDNYEKILNYCAR